MAVSTYVNNTRAELEITSMITNSGVKFPAFLTNISQNFKSTWQTENVFGRNDPIATFQNTTRTVALSWVIPAASVSEAKQNEIKVSKLISYLYPAYYAANNDLNTEDLGPPLPGLGVNANANNLIMAKSPLVKVKFANVIQAQDGSGLLGWIDGVEWKPKIDIGMFASGGQFYAKTIELSFTLNVLHQQDVGYDQNGAWLGNKGNFPFKLE